MAEDMSEVPNSELIQMGTSAAGKELRARDKVIALETDLAVSENENFKLQEEVERLEAMLARLREANERLGSDNRKLRGILGIGQLSQKPIETAQRAAQRELIAYDYDNSRKILYKVPNGAMHEIEASKILAMASTEMYRYQISHRENGQTIHLELFSALTQEEFEAALRQKNAREKKQAEVADLRALEDWDRSQKPIRQAYKVAPNGLSTDIFNMKNLRTLYENRYGLVTREYILGLPERQRDAFDVSGDTLMREYEARCAEDEYPYVEGEVETPYADGYEWTYSDNGIKRAVRIARCGYVENDNGCVAGIYISEARREGAEGTVRMIITSNIMPGEQEVVTEDAKRLDDLRLPIGLEDGQFVDLSTEGLRVYNSKSNKLSPLHFQRTNDEQTQGKNEEGIGKDG